MVSSQTEILWHLPLAKDVFSFSEHAAMDWQLHLRALVRYISYYKDTYAWIPNKNKYRNQDCLQRLPYYRAGTSYSRGTQFSCQPEYRYSDRRFFLCSSLLLDKFQYNTFTIHHSPAIFTSTVYSLSRWRCRKKIHKNYVPDSPSIPYQWMANRVFTQILI
jgi:hypothetical protein